MGNKLLVLVAFSFITPMLLAFALVFYSFLDYQKNPVGLSAQFFAPRQPVAYAALPTSVNIYHHEIVQKDARVEMLKQFFSKYNSPLEPYAEHVVQTADKYNMDFRLIPAIAMQESNLCKKIIKGSHNCWGFGIYGKKVTRFKDYPEGIETVSKGLAKNYLAKGLVTPEQIMTKYTPSSNGSWAFGVNQFMKELQ